MLILKEGGGDDMPFVVILFRVPEYEDRFQHICVHLTHAEWLVRKGIGNAKKIRKENPWKVCTYFIPLSQHVHETSIVLRCFITRFISADGIRSLDPNSSVYTVTR